MAGKIPYCSPSVEERVCRSLDWSDIDIDVFTCIQDKMLFADRLLCRAVCKTWRSITETILTSSLKYNVLVLYKQYFLGNLSGQEDYFEPSSGRCLLNLSGKELFKLDDRSSKLLRELRLCVGVSHGWVLLMDKCRDTLSMFNPSFGIGINNVLSIRCLIRYKITKAVSTADPISGDSNYCIMALWADSDRTMIAFAKCGGELKFYNVMGQVDTWNPNPRYQDIVCYKHCVYATTETGKVLAWDCNRFMTIRCSRSRRVLTHSPTNVLDFQPSFNQGKELQPGCKLHLVESEGNLLLVSRMRFGTAASFQVYKLDFDEKKWVDVDSLGDRVLILFVNQSLSFKAGAFSQFKRNSIYFEDEDGRGPSGMGIFVFNLGIGSAEQIFLRNSR